MIALAFASFWQSPRLLRRLLVTAFLLLCASHLPGCASPGVMCAMKDHYDFETKIPDHGVALMEWDHDASKCRRDQVGCASCEFGNCKLHLMGDVPFSDICGLANLGHEIGHALGKQHERD